MATRQQLVGTWDFASLGEIREVVRTAMAELVHLGPTPPPRLPGLADHCGCAACAQRCRVCAAMVTTR